MAISYSARPWLLFPLSSPSTNPKTSSLFLSFQNQRLPQISLYSTHSYNPSRPSQIPKASAKQQNRNSSSSNNSSTRKRPPPRKKNPPSKTFNVNDTDDDDYESEDKISTTHSKAYIPSPLPKPPAGFVLDPHGNVLMASSKRIATLVDSSNNLPLDCVIRRVFRSSQEDECMLLCPVDTPVQILKSTNIDGWSAVSDEEVEKILPAAAYALAKIHMHLVISGFCYTARGGFCYSEEDIIEFGTDNGQDIDGLPTEGVEITCFHQDGVHYMIYTPSDPLLFVAVKGNNGQLQIADDDLLEDLAVVDAIDEETEFNALVEEEAALLESLLGER
ncbi:hypothetical protein MKW92_008459 [Papaver armeniacum]|nr:hypothetical protein MKW92_008459 [Papaver armeniacum]